MNTKVLKGAAFVLVLIDVVVIFSFIASQSTSVFSSARLFGNIIGFGIAVFILQRIFKWALQKTKLSHETEWTGLIIASLVYLVVFSLFTFASADSSLSNKTLPGNFANDKEAFMQSLSSFKEADSVSSPTGNPFDRLSMDSATKERVEGLLDRGVSLGGSVSDDFLDYLSPGLKDEYREHLLAGEQARSRSMTVADAQVAAFQSGIETTDMSSWNEWWAANQDAVLLKIQN